MQHVIASEDRTTRTPAAVMVSLATPTVSSKEVSTWRLHLPAQQCSPEHTIDRDQVYMPLTGSFTFVGETGTVVAGPGDAIIVPGGEKRQFSAGDQDAEALVAMLTDGAVILPDGGKMPVPWAQ
jgi:mannose-6-phosphate isomerase-like protein (cupin superfamily)